MTSKLTRSRSVVRVRHTLYIGSARNNDCQICSSSFVFPLKGFGSRLWAGVRLGVCRIFAPNRDPRRNRRSVAADRQRYRRTWYFKSMNEKQTCGKVLADRSVLPAKIGQLIAAMVENLEAHQETLDGTDENGKLELHAYVKLAHEFRCIATQEQATAADMAGYRPADGETRSSEDGIP